MPLLDATLQFPRDCLHCRGFLVCSSTYRVADAGQEMDGAQLYFRKQESTESWHRSCILTSQTSGPGAGAGPEGDVGGRRKGFEGGRRGPGKEGSRGEWEGRKEGGIPRCKDEAPPSPPDVAKECDGRSMNTLYSLGFV